jgi:2,4-diaminopentanoate dehydrogenase
MGMALRVIQWATGGVGRAAIAGVLAHPELELVGCWVHSPDKAGRDVGELCGGDPIGVAATNDIDALLSLDADCVIYSPIMADPSVVARLLASGKNVVTPLNWFFSGGRDESPIEEACRVGRATIHGTGIHPGGITERFPLAVSALSQSITHVRAEEFSDIRSYGAPTVVGDIMLFGKTPEEAAASMMPALLGDGFGQSIAMIGHSLEFDLDPELAVSHKVAVATAPIDSPIGVIQPGRIAAQKFCWQGTVRGTPVVTVRTNWFMGDEHLDPAWTFGPDGERFEVEVTGDPSSQVTFHGWHPESVAAGLLRNPGIVATATHCVSAVPAVVAAEPGIKSYLDLVPYSGRAAGHLR